MSIFSKLFEMLGDWKKYSRYLIVGSIVFFLGMIWHFPLERFGSIISTTIQKETGATVVAEKLSLTLPVGVHAKNVQIILPGNPNQIQLEELTLRPSIFGFITYPFRKVFSVSYKAIRGKETWSGSASFGKEISSFQVKVKNFQWAGSIPLDQNPMFAGRSINIDTSVNVEMAVTGKTIALQQLNLSEAEGYFELHSKKANIEAPMVNQVNFSDVTIEADIKKGILGIKNINLESPNLNGQAKGSIKIAPFLPNSQLQLEARIKSDSKDPNMSSLIQLLGSMYSIQPSSDGTLGLRINGPLNSVERMSISSL